MTQKHARTPVKSPARTIGSMIPPGSRELSPLSGTLLVAMPTLREDTFNRSVVYLCSHSPEGAMGIVINQAVPEVKFKDLMAQLKLPHEDIVVNPVVHFGGPVEQGRGFVLHSTDFMRDDTVRLGNDIGITGTIDILRAMSEGHGPKKSIFALGYAGWGPGQLDAEIQNNYWLTVPVDDDLLFGGGLANKWERAMLKIGVNPAALSFEAGHA